MLRIGTEVRLKSSIDKPNIPEGRENHETAKIKGFVDNVDGGLFLDRDLGAMRYWHKDDVERVDTVVVAEAAPGEVMDEASLMFLREQFLVLASFSYFFDGKMVMHAPREEAYKNAVKVIGKHLGFR